MGADHVTKVERQLADAQQIAHVGSWEWEVASGHLSWSDELYRIYGLNPCGREMTLEFFLSCIHADDRAAVQRRIAGVLERAGRFQWPERIVRPDGSVRELDTIGEAIADEAGAVRRLIGTCRDGTEERQQTRQVRLYADIVQNVQIGLSVWSWADGDGGRSLRLAAFNPAAEVVARTALEPYIGRTFAEIVPYAAGAGRDYRIRHGPPRSRLEPCGATSARRARHAPICR